MREQLPALGLFAIVLGASGCVPHSTQESSSAHVRPRSARPSAQGDRRFSELNPHYRDRAGAFYDIKYVSPSAEALFKIADVRPDQMRKTLSILRSFVDDWLIAYVEGNGSITGADVQECVRRMDARFDALFDELQRKQYRLWRDDASGKHNRLRFLI